MCKEGVWVRACGWPGPASVERQLSQKAAGSSSSRCDGGGGRHGRQAATRYGLMVVVWVCGVGGNRGGGGEKGGGGKGGERFRRPACCSCRTSVKQTTERKEGNTAAKPVGLPALVPFDDGVCRVLFGFSLPRHRARIVESRLPRSSVPAPYPCSASLYELLLLLRLRSPSPSSPPPFPPNFPSSSRPPLVRDLCPPLALAVGCIRGRTHTYTRRTYI